MTAEGEELAQALAQLQSELQHYRARGDQRNEAIALHRLGPLLQDHGRPEQARACYEQALPIFQRLDDFQSQVATLHNLGQLYENLEQSEHALACYQQALTILRTLGEPGNEAVTVINLGRLAHHQERHEEARALCQRLGGESPSQEKQQLQSELQQGGAQAQAQSGGDSQGLTPAAAAADFYAALAALLEGQPPALPRTIPTLRPWPSSRMARLRAIRRNKHCGLNAHFFQISFTNLHLDGYIHPQRIGVY
jgi:tetratricopeptide (TPR) repeat protein